MARKKERIDLREAIDWIQVKDAVVPVVQRRSSSGSVQHLIPLSVVRYGALLRDLSPLKPFESSASERDRLSEICRRAGFHFCFPKNTELLCLTDFISLFKDKVYIAILPATEPFRHIRVSDSGDQWGQSEGSTKETDVDVSEKHRHKSSPQPLDLSKHRRMNSAVDVELEEAVDQINASGSSFYFELSHKAIVRQLSGKEVVCLEKNAVEYVTLQNLHIAFFRQVLPDVFMAGVRLIGLPSVHLPPEYHNINVQIPPRMVRLDDACAAVERLKAVFGMTTAIGGEMSSEDKKMANCGYQQENRSGISGDNSLRVDEDQWSNQRPESLTTRVNKRKRLLDTISQLHLKKSKHQPDGVI